MLCQNSQIKGGPCFGDQNHMRRPVPAIRDSSETRMFSTQFNGNDLLKLTRLSSLKLQGIKGFEMNFYLGECRQDFNDFEFFGKDQTQLRDHS
ncbi:MAG: hypothetical protein RJA81_209 [Planctomycetota bacterium]